MKVFNGIPVSPGVAIGTAVMLLTGEVRVSRRRIKRSEAPSEIARWEAGREKARTEIEQIRQRVRNTAIQEEVALIFDSHLRILDDPVLDSEIRDSITKDHNTADQAANLVLRKIINTLQGLGDDFFSQRATDFQDIKRRLLRALTGVSQPSSKNKSGEPRKSVVIAHDLTPSETASLTRGEVLAFVTDLGGATSHTAILANALGIPAVVGLHRITHDASPGDTVIVDGTTGRVILNPDPEVEEKYLTRASQLKAEEQALIEAASSLPGKTADGTQITLLANVEFDDEVAPALRLGAQGLGLFRTEFIYARHPKPTEEDHFAYVSRALAALGGRPMTVRTLDFGADKFREEIGLEKEENPFLGYRSLRMCLGQPEILRTQFRALLRASASGKLRIMLPMVGSLDELRKAREIYQGVRQELAAQGIAFDPDIPIGVMIEVPGAAIIAERLAAECDFMSIGTNDLVQYTLAVDRNNPKVGHLYHHTHPAVLVLIQKVLEAGKAAGKPVSVCGEMAGDPRLGILLAGLGLRIFSTTPTSIPGLKTVLSKITISRAEEVARECMSLDTTAEIDAVLDRVLTEELGERPRFSGKYVR